MGLSHKTTPTECLEDTPKLEKLKPPPFYRVIMLNDDYTPMEFVILLLQTFFSMGYERAHSVMMQIHEKGRGVCGAFPKDIAETKCAQVMQTAKKNKHPLKCIIERME